MLGSKDSASPPGEDCLELSPDGGEHRWGTGLLDIAIDASVDNSNRIAGEDGLVVALAEEVSVEDRSEERVLEGERATDNAHEDHEFSVSNGPHCAIVVGCEASMSANITILGNDATYT